LVNTQDAVPPESSAVHHLTEDDLCMAPAWDWVKEQIGVGSPSVFAAHYADFEKGWLTTDIIGTDTWICTFKCALRLWPDAPSHSNQSLRYWLKHEGLCRATAEKAHRAGPDSYVTAFHLRKMLTLASVAQLIEWTSQPALLITCRLPAHRGILWRDVPSSYLEWVADKSTLDENTKFTARHWLTARES
jgi:exodeoxyribonuclease X